MTGKEGKVRMQSRKTWSRSSLLYTCTTFEYLVIIVQRMGELDDINDARKSLSFAEIGEHKTTLTSLDLSIVLGNEALP